MKQTVVLGPPGCGKTTHLLNRVQQEMADGVHPSRIMYVSFTRKAAGEAVERAVAKFNAERKDFPYFRTLHSLAYQQLGLSSEAVLSAKHYRRIGEALGLQFSDYMNFEDGTYAGNKNGDEVLYLAAMARATLTDPETMWRRYQKGSVDWWQLKQFLDLLADYKRQNALLDFPDMLDNFVQQCDPLDVDVAFIDEAQDLSRQQWRMVEHATRKAKRVYVAGDDDQAIYRWSGADVDSFLNLPGEYMVLDQSYRLPATVHALCNRIAKRIRNRHAKQWRPRTEPGVVQHVHALEDIAWQDGSYLLLARNRYLLNNLTTYVRALGIPYAVNNKSAIDPDAVRAIQSWERLRRGQQVSGADARVVYAHMRVGTGVRRGFKRLAEVADADMVDMAHLQQHGGLQRTDIWHDALEHIPGEEREFYLAALRRGEKITRVPRVHISTVHGVKGGEADHVVVVSDMAARTYNDFQAYPDDEHRVAYVAASRARKSLTLLLPQSTRAYPYSTV